MNVVIRPILTKPREDSDINPRLLHRVKTYIGTTSSGVHADRLSIIEAKGQTAKYGALLTPKKTDTKVEIMMASLHLMGYTQQSISDTSVQLFGKHFSRDSVKRACKNVLKSNREYGKRFLNKIYREPGSDAV